MTVNLVGAATSSVIVGVGPGLTSADRSCTNTSENPFVSPLTRLSASEENVTYRPSAEILEDRSLPLLCTPLALTETSVVTFVAVSRTNISSVPFVSPLTRLLAFDTKATYRPSPEMDVPPEPASVCTPSRPTETRVVVFKIVSRTKISEYPFVSPSTRLEELE